MYLIWTMLFLLLLQLLRKYHRFDGPSGETVHSWTNMTCCMPRQNCIERNSWIRAHTNDQRLKFAEILGLQVALGNANFHEESFRACTDLSLNHIEICPWAIQWPKVRKLLRTWCDCRSTAHVVIHHGDLETIRLSCDEVLYIWATLVKSVSSCCTSVYIVKNKFV